MFNNFTVPPSLLPLFLKHCVAPKVTCFFFSSHKERTRRKEQQGSVQGRYGPRSGRWRGDQVETILNFLPGFVKS